jgi:hypothetical protein
MKVQFEFTATDVADVAQRSSTRSKAIREWRWIARIGWASLISLALFFAIDGPLVRRLIFSLAILLGLIALYPYIFRTSATVRYRKYYREQFGGDGPFSCEVEIAPTGLTVTQHGAETRRPWRNIQELVDTAGAIEIRCKPTGLVVVRDRAFQTTQQRAEFLRLARDYLASKSNS